MNLRSHRAHAENPSNPTLSLEHRRFARRGGIEDQTCPDPLEGACETPTSWRWDFDPDLLGASLPEASGSGEQYPVYTYTEASDELRVVSMVARNADQGSLAQLDLTVIAPVEVTIDVDDPVVLPAAVGCMIDFSGRLPEDLSPLDPVDSWF